MTLSRREVLIAGAAAPLAGLWAGTTVAQERLVPPEQIEDPFLAAELLIIGRKQIANSQLARQHTQDRDVRTFAEAEVAEHQALQARLSDRGFQYPTVTPVPAAVSGGAPVDAVPGVPGNPPPEPTANRPIVLPPGTRPANNAVPPPARPIVTPAPAAGPNASTPLIHVGRVTLSVGASRLILIETEVGEQCMATFRGETGILAGAAFDKAYVSGQLYEHYGLLDRVTAFRRHATATFLPVLDEALPTIQRHITTLKGLIVRLDGSR